METALNGIVLSSKNSQIKDAVAAAKEAVKNSAEHGDVPIPYLRDKCLAAIELAFDHGNEKTAHFAVDAVQVLLRDQRFHSISIENPQHNLPTQILHSMTGIAQWSSQLQCYCLTLLVEMICSTELKISLQEVEEALELFMRVYGASREESVRVSARASVSQSTTSYFFNRYAASDESQDKIAIYLDVTNLLESYCMKLDQMTTSNDQSVVIFDAMNALLASQSLTIQSHTPFVNLLWEKLCPLMIRLLGVPDKNISSTTIITVSTEEPMGQGQINKFPLSPSVIANPDATRALYQILEQLIRIMAGIPSVASSLEALLHKAFLFPKIEQRSEAVKVIRKIVSDPRRIGDLVAAAVRDRSLSLWRMIVVCIFETANPSYEISLDSVRTCGFMLQGILDYSRSTQIMDCDTRARLREMFHSLPEASVKSFTARSDLGNSSPRPSTDRQGSELTQNEASNADEQEPEDEISKTLKKLTKKFGMSSFDENEVHKCKPILQRRSTEYDETSEKVTAKKFADSLMDRIIEWEKEKSTLLIDNAILEFATSFYSDFSAVHNEVFKSKSKVQQEFLNTDAIYLSVYASLSLGHRGPEKVTWERFKESVFLSGCIVYVSESWLLKVYQHICEYKDSFNLNGALRDVVQDYDGFDNKLLSDVERLKTISQGPSKQPYEERLATRWLVTASWDCIVSILSTFLGVQERRCARQKIAEGIEHSIHGMQVLTNVALDLELGDRCGWIFEKLVEASCDLEELRTSATAEEQKRFSIVSRIDLLSMQMCLDHAFVALHAPECWKHVIRCTEYVWELEKYIYGALCYEKPQKFSFGRKTVEEKPEKKVEEDVAYYERSIEYMLGEKELDRDGINKALAVLIAKVDRFYSLCGRQLNLKSLRDLSVSLVNASENRIIYSDQKAPALSPSVNLLSRISEILSLLHARPLAHQMLVWPIVGAHFTQVSCCGEESRSGVTALSESVSSLLLAESNGMCFNQMLLVPFQSIVCSELCTPETRQQLVLCLSDYVRTKSDTLRSAWKPLFGTLRAVRTSSVEDASVHWTVLDVISTYLNIKKCSVLSWSLLDCFACIVHFLQSTETTELDSQLSEAALHLIQPTYAVILNLFKTPHSPSHNLLHRADLRIHSIDEVDDQVHCLSATKSLIPALSSTVDPGFYAHNTKDTDPIKLDGKLDVPRGTLSWIDKDCHETASIELVLTFFEHLCGTLVTAPSSVQPPLLRSIHQLLCSIRDNDFGFDTASFCVSALLFPYVQKWLRRPKEADEVRNIKQALGTCTEIVLEFLSGHEGSVWSNRLLADGCRVAVECSGQPNDFSRVGAACLRHLSTACVNFNDIQWTILQKALWDSCSATLHPIRLLLSCAILENTTQANLTDGLMIDKTSPLSIMDRVLAEQVFYVDIQKRSTFDQVEDEMSAEDSDDPQAVSLPKKHDFTFSKNGSTFRFSLQHIVSSLLAHQVVLQLIGSLLSPTTIPHQMIRVLSESASLKVLEKISDKTRSVLYYCLDASFQVAREFDNNVTAVAYISKCSDLEFPNLLKQLVSAGLIKLVSLFHHAKTSKSIEVADQLSKALNMIIAEFKRIENATAFRRMAIAAREHRPQHFDFRLVEIDADKLYKVVTENEIADIYSAYRLTRPIKKPVVERQNPFVSIMNPAAEEEQPPSEIDPDSYRLMAYRDVCLTPFQLLLTCESEESKDLFKALLPTAKNLILSSPDIAIRELAVQLVDVLSSQLDS